MIGLKNIFSSVVILIIICCFFYGISVLFASTDSPSGKKEVLTNIENKKIISSDDVVIMEMKLREDPNNSDIRNALIDYYYWSIDARNKEDMSKFRSHLLWLIRHNPESAVLGKIGPIGSFILSPDDYTKAKNIWMLQIQKHGKNENILANAAKLFEYNDREIAKGIYIKLKEKNPNCSKWPRRLANIYRREYYFKSDHDRKKYAKNWLGELETALKIEKNSWRRYSLYREIADVSLILNDVLKAMECISQMELLSDKIKKNNYAISGKEKCIIYQYDGFDKDDVLHSTYSILGRIALANGNISLAKRYLLDSANEMLKKRKGECELEQDLRLAKYLLKKGERDSVVQYLKLCKKIWKNRSKDYDAWIKLINQNTMPNFDEK